MLVLSTPSTNDTTNTNTTTTNSHTPKRARGRTHATTATTTTTSTTTITSDICDLSNEKLTGVLFETYAKLRRPEAVLTPLLSVLSHVGDAPLPRYFVMQYCNSLRALPQGVASAIWELLVLSIRQLIATPTSLSSIKPDSKKRMHGGDAVADRSFKGVEIMAMLLSLAVTNTPVAPSNATAYRENLSVCRVSE